MANVLCSSCKQSILLPAHVPAGYVFRCPACQSISQTPCLQQAGFPQPQYLPGQVQTQPNQQQAYHSTVHQAVFQQLQYPPGQVQVQTQPNQQQVQHSTVQQVVIQQLSQQQQPIVQSQQKKRKKRKPKRKPEPEKLTWRSMFTQDRVLSMGPYVIALIEELTAMFIIGDVGGVRVKATSMLEDNADLVSPATFNEWFTRRRLLQFGGFNFSASIPSMNSMINQQYAAAVSSYSGSESSIRDGSIADASDVLRNPLVLIFTINTLTSMVQMLALVLCRVRLNGTKQLVFAACELARLGVVIYGVNGNGWTVFFACLSTLDLVFLFMQWRTSKRMNIQKNVHEDGMVGIVPSGSKAVAKPQDDEPNAKTEEGEQPDVETEPKIDETAATEKNGQTVSATRVQQEQKAENCDEVEEVHDCFEFLEALRNIDVFLFFFGTVFVLFVSICCSLHQDQPYQLKFEFYNSTSKTYRHELSPLMSQRTLLNSPYPNEFATLGINIFLFFYLFVGSLAVELRSQDTGTSYLHAKVVSGLKILRAVLCVCVFPLFICLYLSRTYNTLELKNFHYYNYFKGDESYRAKHYDSQHCCPFPLATASTSNYARDPNNSTLCSLLSSDVCWSLLLAGQPNTLRLPDGSTPAASSTHITDHGLLVVVIVSCVLNFPACVDLLYVAVTFLKHRQKSRSGE